MDERDYDTKLQHLKNKGKDLDRPFDDDLEEIPYYLRERVAMLVDQKVEKRVDEYMA